jgi:hypothetical protein
MVRAIRDAIYEETKDLSREELKAFFAREAEAFRRETKVRVQVSSAPDDNPHSLS